MRLFSDAVSVFIGTVLGVAVGLGPFLGAADPASNMPRCYAREVEFEVSCVKEKEGYPRIRSTSGSSAIVFWGCFFM